MSELDIRGLTVQQPWATLIAHGAKCIETRSWHTFYRGWLVIHASASFPVWCRKLVKLQPFADVVGTLTLPLGKIIAVGYLDAIRPITESYARKLGRIEYTFGDYTPGRFAWELSSVRMLAEPIPYKGRLGCWHVRGDDAVRILTAARLAA